MTGDSHGGRARAEWLGGTRFRFHWPCGGKRTKDYGEGPAAKRMGAAGCEIMARMWRTSGTSGLCPKCKRRACSYTTEQLAQIEKVTPKGETK